MRRAWRLLLVPIALYGCASTPPQPVELTHRSDHFDIIRTAREGTVSTATRAHLGDARLASHVARANGMDADTVVPAGTLLAVPRRPLNAAHIYPDGVRQIQVLCYHRFSEQPSDDPMVVTRSRFEAQMHHLAEAGYTVVALDTLHRFADGETLLPEKLVAITIDDGYASVADIAEPILARFGFPATLFVYPQFVGGGLALSWPELRAIERRGTIDVQSHSATHGSHVQQPGETDTAYQARLHQEAERAEQALTRQLDKKPTQYAYPYGDISSQAMATLAERGYATAFTVRRGGNPSYAPSFAYGAR